MKLKEKCTVFYYNNIPERYESIAFLTTDDVDSAFGY